MLRSRIGATLTLALVGLLASCVGADTGVTYRNCYQTAAGVRCLTSSTGAIGESADADGDGVEDTFVCTDGDSVSDSAENDSDSAGDPADPTDPPPPDGTPIPRLVEEEDPDSDSMVDSADSAGDTSDSDADDDGVPDPADCDDGDSTSDSVSSDSGSTDDEEEQEGENP